MKNDKIVFPLIFAFYPFLALFATNIDQIQPISALRAGIFVLFFNLLVYSLFRLLVRNPEKAALLAGLVLLFFYTYGHIYDLLQGKTLFGLIIGRHRILFPLWGLSLTAGLAAIWKLRRDLTPYNRVLNILGLTLLALPSASLAWYTAQSIFLHQRQLAAIKTAPAVLESPTNRPDVYYIILDSYSRDDVLKTLYDFDNSAFTAELTRLGFYVARCSQSNYSITALSLASSLNMDYLNKVNAEVINENRNWAFLDDSIKHSRVRQEFEQIGYTTVAFETGAAWDEILDAGMYISRVNYRLQNLREFTTINPFEMVMLRTTALRVAVEGESFLLERLNQDVTVPDKDQYERVLFVFDQLKSLPDVAKPKFVFAHLIAPHPPYVFTPQGSYQVFPDKKPGFTNAISYLNTRTLDLVRTLISNSKTPPVILIQADHALDSEGRTRILNAYYLPGAGSTRLYPQFTPVNSFRLILNQYFGANFTLLPDISYLSAPNDPYQFIQAPDTCPSP